MLVTLLVAGEVAFAAPSRAHAHALAPSPDDVERARVLDENARQLYDEGAYEGAILAWKKAYELTEYNNLLYNISMAYDRAGDFEKALEYLDRYRALASPEERPQLERKKKSLKARLDKQKKDAEAAAAAEADADDPAEDTPPPPPEEATDTGAPEAKPPRLFTPAAWALTGVGALGFGLGIGFGAASLAATRRAKDGCTGDGLCSTNVKSEVARARQNAIVADVGIAIGAVCTVAVVALVAVQAKKRKQARAAAMAPVILPGGAGVGVAARF
jgi:tetratricopeptide (TPR) repeat protein